jgi:uncharacterized membrane protein
MEAYLRDFAGGVSLATDMLCVIAVAIGGALTLAAVGKAIIERRFNQVEHRRSIVLRFGRWIILALEFSLGGLIARTTIAPTWDDLGQLAAIGAIRVGLSFFLRRDLERFASDGGALHPSRDPRG